MLAPNLPPDMHSFGGGVETSVKALLEGLAAFPSGMEIRVVSVAHGIPRNLEMEEHGIHYLFIKSPPRRWLRPRLPFRIWQMYRAIRRLQPDLVNVQGNMAAGVAALLAGRPMVFSIHGIMKHEASQRSGWEFWSAQMDVLLEAAVARFTRNFICNSGYASTTLKRGKRVFMIPNAVREAFLNETPSPERAHPPRILFIGVIAPLKRPLDLVLAHARLRERHPALETFLCGDVEDEAYQQKIKAAISGQHIEGVHFMGRLDQPQLIQMLHTSKVLALISSQENSPMALLEAMACAVPVVASRVGGVPEMVKDGQTGFLIAPGNLDELTDALDKLLGDPGLARRIGLAGREECRASHHPSLVAEKTVQAFRALLED
jgi:glycosyltransferase involved in cell wall biosynthesis